MTECNQSSFGFEACGKREIVARFDGGTISSDGGALLLRQTDRRLNLLRRLAECFLDGRNQRQVEHSVLEMLSQRVYGLALGYEDINDHEQLRNDPVFSILSGRTELERGLAGKSTLNRMELGNDKPDRYKKITSRPEAVDELLVKVFIESHQQAPEEIILDVDTTDLPLHGQQEGRFFHGYSFAQVRRSLHGLNLARISHGTLVWLKNRAREPFFWAARSATHSTGGTNRQAAAFWWAKTQKQIVFVRLSPFACASS